jgi:hypothetical protein
LGPITVGVVGLVAVGVAISAIAVVSPEPFGDTGGVLPTRPLTTTTAPPADPVQPSPGPAARHEGALCCATGDRPDDGADDRTTDSPTGAAGSATAAEPYSSVQYPPAPSSAHPTTHQPFPQETTDFLGPPGTNH